MSRPRSHPTNTPPQVYNSSKAAVIQLARNLAMEWSPIRKDGTGGIRVNCISPGHILTPMVRKNFEEVPGLREKWEAANMSTSLSSNDELSTLGFDS
jgi:NAD(P)-dependent dehydrogenase (short-subunit alcohol dehydrogenase family)